MLRLDYFLSRGGVLCNGDRLTDGLSFSVYTDGAIKRVCDNSERYAIKHFAKRENTGKNPMCDFFPLIAEIADGSIERGVACNFTWEIGGFDYDIIQWSPDAGELYKQQKLDMNRS